MKRRFPIYFMTPVSVANLLLDDEPALAGFSLRKLSATYSGSAVKIRRSSDDTEQDVGFSGNDFDTASAESFCGAGDGFIVTWYDQSGNGNDFTQSTATKQAQIVSSGSVLTLNSKPAIQFDGTDDSVDFSTQLFGINQSHTHFCVFDTDVNDGSFRAVISSSSSSSNRAGITINSGTISYGLYNGSSYPYAKSGSLSTNTQYLSSIVYDNGVEVTFDLNDTTQAGTDTPALNRLAGTNIGSQTDSDDKFWDGAIQEVIIYQSDKTSSVDSIEADINSYYGIY